MTCIVGLVDKRNKKVVIGGDSAGVDTHTLGIVTRSDEKVFTNGPYLLGFTSSFRMGQLLRYSIELPAPDTWDVNKFMVTKFIDAIREGAVKAGWAGRDPDGRENFGSFLVGFEDKLYCVEDDLQVGINSIGYAAIGCGQDFAMGSIYATKEAHYLSGEKEDVSETAHVALKAASTFSAGVRGPFVIMST